MYDIPRIDGNTAACRYEDYFAHSRPVIVTGVVESWPACGKWTPGYLRSALGSTPVPVGVSTSSQFRLDPLRSELEFPRRKVPFHEYADYVESGDRNGSGQHYYLQRLPVAEYCPGLLPDLPPLDFVDPRRLTSLNLWFGPHASSTALHWDDYDNAMAQISGSKRFSLFAPADTQHLYPHSALSRAPHQSRVNIDEPDAREFPGFSLARRHECVLQAGELLLLPACWWHQTSSIGTSISVNTWWKADIRSLLRPNVALMMRELSRAGALTALRSSLSNVVGAANFMDAAVCAGQTGEHWMCAMLALAAVEEHLIFQARRDGILREERLAGPDVLKLAEGLLNAGKCTRARLQELETLFAQARGVRESAFADADSATAASILRSATELLASPHRTGTAVN
jgi:[protein]-arginine 3-hydroxylase / protease